MPIDLLEFLTERIDAAPDDAFQLSRSLKTLELRVLRQSATALTLARRLERDRRVRHVLYPGLPSHPDHRVAKRQLHLRAGAGDGPGSLRGHARGWNCRLDLG